MRCHALYLGIVVSILAMSSAASAQNTGTLSAQVIVPGGSPAGLVVVASLSVPDAAADLSGQRGFGVLTNMAGQASFAGLPFGIYSVCVEPNNGILVDHCLWAPPPTVHLTSQNPTGSINLTVLKGIPIDIRIDDPQGLLSSPSTNQGLSVSIVTPAGPHNLLPVIKDPGGVNYRILAPPSVASSIQISAGSLQIVDPTGTAVNFSPGSAPSFNFGSTSSGQFLRYRLRSSQ